MRKYQLSSDSDLFDLTAEEVSQLELNIRENGTAHVLIDNQSIDIQKIQQGSNPKEISVSINGDTFHFTLKDKNDQLVDQLGMDSQSTKKLSNIAAPMPGLILEILVNAGDSFEKGDPLFVLEAMKMENMIKAEGAGIVKEVLSKIQDTVEKNQIILDLKEV